ncbi:alkaline proteinase precursor [Purpureocillium lavendulum]|uniref:Alkaline proteinase n=1 Tax=Purpureocillium lavendulum TaxID=1247861 RepID=A0AB34FVF8_9HYPO|nr:alkaline proteinase precursor [Purpureocillium lavendulum]
MVNFKSLAVAAFFSQALAAPMIPDSSVVEVEDFELLQSIEGKYIVTLKPGSEVQDLDAHISWVNGVQKRGVGEQYKGVEKTYTGQYDFNAYTGHFDEATVAEIRNSPNVASVEEDKLWSLEDMESDESEVDSRKTFVKQRSATWGLGTISHRQSGTSEYIVQPDAGKGMYAYVVDTGIRTTHSEFEGRASTVYSAFKDETTDTYGHGTHVAGTIGGKTYGVAKKAQLLSVKVFKGRTSTTSTILDGFNFAANDIISKGRNKKAVINMSLGGGASDAFNRAVESAAKQGILSVVAAGNTNTDAGLRSPASAPSALAVGAIDADWRIASYSNWGKVVRIFAPGSRVKSAWYTNDKDTNIISGTSMATPHVVGLALHVMSVDGITGADAVIKRITSTATKNKVKGDIHGSANLIANNNNSVQK